MQWLVRSAIRDMYPGGEGFPSVDETGLREFVARTARESTWLFWTGVVLGSWLYAWTPLLTVFVPLPAFLLPRALREQHASKITSHPHYLLRQAVFLPKMLGGLCWAQDARVRAKLALPAYEPDPGTWRKA